MWTSHQTLVCNYSNAEVWPPKNIFKLRQIISTDHWQCLPGEQYRRFCLFFHCRYLSATEIKRNLGKNVNEHRFSHPSWNWWCPKKADLGSATPWSIQKFTRGTVFCIKGGTLPDVSSYILLGLLPTLLDVRHGVESDLPYPYLPTTLR